MVDATYVQPAGRKLRGTARANDVLPVAIVLDLPEKVCTRRNRGRADRSFGPHVVRNQMSQLRKGLRGLSREGFRYVYVLESAQRRWRASRSSGSRCGLQPAGPDHGPFDIIGDAHGCYDELVELLGKLGYGMRPPMGSGGGNRRARGDRR